MIRATHAAHPQGTLVAYADNSVGDRGRDASIASIRATMGVYGANREDTAILMKVETHNHPTAIAPFPGAATGVGRRDPRRGRDGRRRQAQGGSRRLHGLAICAFPSLVQPWEIDAGKPERIASALSIMLDGPIGAAAFNNEFGRPNLAGYFRTFERRSTARCAAITSRS